MARVRVVRRRRNRSLTWQLGESLERVSVATERKYLGVESARRRGLLQPSRHISRDSGRRNAFKGLWSER